MPKNRKVSHGKTAGAAAAKKRRPPKDKTRRKGLATQSAIVVVGSHGAGQSHSDSVPANSQCNERQEVSSRGAEGELLPPLAVDLRELSRRFETPGAMRAHAEKISDEELVCINWQIGTESKSFSDYIATFKPYVIELRKRYRKPGCRTDLQRLNQSLTWQRFVKKAYGVSCRWVNHLLADGRHAGQADAKQLHRRKSLKAEEVIPKAEWSKLLREIGLQLDAVFQPITKPQKYAQALQYLAEGIAARHGQPVTVSVSAAVKRSAATAEVIGHARADISISG